MKKTKNRNSSMDYGDELLSMTLSSLEKEYDMTGVPAPNHPLLPWNIAFNPLGAITYIFSKKEVKEESGKTVEVTIDGKTYTAVVK